MNLKFLKIFIMFLVAVGVTTTIIYLTGEDIASPNEEIQTFSYNEFMQNVRDKQVAKVEYSTKDTKIKGELKDGTLFETNKPTDEFNKQLLESEIEVVLTDKKPSNAFTNFLVSLLNIGLTAGVFIFVMRWVSKSLIKTQASSMDRRFTLLQTSDYTFDDVAGNEEAKADLAELIEFLKNPIKYKRYGAEIPKGTLLSGAPGNGKTLMVKALAGEAGVSFISVSGSDFVQQFVGVGAARVRELFDVAKKNAPCIIFIDEIDAMGRVRSSSSSGATDERDQTLNQLLVEMDGFNPNKGVLVVAATNRPELLDPALLRPGRFDRHINVELPDVNARYEILKIHARNKPLAEETDLRKVAEMTIMMSGADLKNIMNEASIYAARLNHKGILMEDIERAINKIIAGEEKSNRSSISRKDKEITAYHEAGHALVAKLVANKKIPKITIIPTTKGFGGYTLITPQEKMYETKQEMLNEIKISLGGRAAEEVVFGEANITSGAGQDLKVVTQIAERMVKDYGMGKNIGLVNINELYRNSYTGSTSEMVVNEIKDLIEVSYKETKEIINTNKAILHNLAQALLEKETIYEEEINAIINGIEFESQREEKVVRESVGRDSLIFNRCKKLKLLNNE